MQFRFDELSKELFYFKHLSINANLSLISRNTCRLITNSTNMNTPCRVLHRSVSKKNGLIGDIRNEINSIVHMTPAITDNRKYNVNLKFKNKHSVGLVNLWRKKMYISLFWLSVIWMVEFSFDDIIFAAWWTRWKLMAVKMKNITFNVIIIPTGT